MDSNTGPYIIDVEHCFNQFIYPFVDNATFFVQMVSSKCFQNNMADTKNVERFTILRVILAQGPC